MIKVSWTEECRKFWRGFVRKQVFDTNLCSISFMFLRSLLIDFYIFNSAIFNNKKIIYFGLTMPNYLRTKIIYRLT